MYELSQLINSIDPWWIIFFALILVSIDWLLLGSEIFLILGIAVLKLAIALFVNPNFEHSAWLVPLFLTSSFFFQRRLLRPIIYSRHPDEETSIVGTKGIIQKNSDNNEAQDVFFDYDVSIERTKKPSIETASIQLKDGRRFTVANHQDVTDGSTAKITQDVNGIVTVKEI